MTTTVRVSIQRRNREQASLVDAVDRLGGTFPFSVAGVDTDNDSEFLNEVLIGFCEEHGIELTRSRPYRKNDQAWVEQKNGAVVRRRSGMAVWKACPAPKRWPACTRRRACS